MPFSSSCIQEMSVRILKKEGWTRLSPFPAEKTTARSRSFRDLSDFEDAAKVCGIGGLANEEVCRHDRGSGRPAAAW